jgi:hypothetical protein
MSDRAFPATVAHGAPRQYTTIGDLIAHAAGHARNRLLHACEAISWVAGLAPKTKGKKGAKPTFTLVGARVQDAKARGGEQAAHVLPGQLLIGDREPWTLALGQRARVRWLARFMVTSAVPAPFNRADSAAEQAGLKEAFRVACEQAWAHAAAGQRDITPTFESFLRAADRAFLDAEQGKGARAKLGAKAARDERLGESVILRAYRAHGVTAAEANRLFPLA